MDLIEYNEKHHLWLSRSEWHKEVVRKIKSTKTKGLKLGDDR